MAPPYGTVTEQHDRILIVACGPSVMGVDLSNVPPRVYVIGVNGAGIWCDRLDAWFSLDPSPYVRGIARLNRSGVQYFMAVPDDYGESGAVCVCHRDPPEPHVTFLRRVVGNGHGHLRTNVRLSGDPGAIHTGNSAFGALGVAYHMHPRKVAFVGLDASDDGHAYSDEPSVAEGRPNFDALLPDMFASAVSQIEARGIRVRNGSPRSAVTCFPRVDPSAALRWVAR